VAELISDKFQLSLSLVIHTSIKHISGSKKVMITKIN